MAASRDAQWTVVVIVEEDESLTGTYRMSPNTQLSNLMQVWRGDFELFGRWVFKSANEEVTYSDESKTLEMIGETIPRARIVHVKAELRDEPMPNETIEIFVHVKDKCHRLFVKSHEKLYRVMWQLPGNPKRLEFNGLPLDLKDTVQQAGLLNNSIVHESQCSIPVKLSSGITVAVKLPSDSIVLNLVEKVNFYEAKEFALRCQGRCLRPEESIAQLEHAVEVSIAEFVVNVDGRRVCWRTKDAPISLPEFNSQLALEGNIDMKKVEILEFECVGCQRRIRNSQTDMQLLPVECCQVRSLTLNAVERSDSASTSEGSDATKVIQGLHQHLVQHRLEDSRTTSSRCVCREMKGKCVKEILDYNVLTRCSCNLLRRISELEEKMKALDAENQRLDTDNKRLDTENKRLDTDNKRLDTKNKRYCHELDEKLGVPLRVNYLHDQFTPIPRPEVQSRGQVPWHDSGSFITCQVPGIRPGSVPVEEVIAVLQRLFTSQGWKIAGVGQRRGVVTGREVARATSCDDELVKYAKHASFCDIDGAEHSWEEAGKPKFQVFPAGGRLFICGGRRRTVLDI